jgi:pimeloyl-ACP methyl ester carboxylesterase
MPLFIWWILGGIIFLTALVYFFQEKFIFKPEKLRQDFQFKYDIPFREYFFDVAEGARINGLHFYREQPFGLILYFHGNTRSIKGWAKYAKDFYRYNYDVVMVDYRGFGKSIGKRGEKAMLADMQFVYSTLAKKYGEAHMIVYGRSIGSGFATKIASENSPRYLILDAPYYSFLKVVERFVPILPVRLVLRYHFRTDKWIGKVACHVYIIHGELDWLIPIRHSEKLQKLNPDRVTLIRIRGGGHNNLPKFDQYHSFVRDILKYS